MKQNILNRDTGAVIYTAEINATEKTPAPIRLGMAVRAALAVGVNLAGADLAGADLLLANLSDANLSRANLTRSNLSGANLTRSNLSGADLTNTCLHPLSTWAWAQANAVHICAIEGRTLILARRTRTSQHVGSQDYSEPGVYRAAVWSSDTTTECHPGLYLAGKHGEILCAAWLDEGVALSKGLRVRRFRKLAAETDEEGVAEVATWGPDALEAWGVAVKGWTEQETA